MSPYMVDASASKMRQAGLECQIETPGRFLGFDMSIVFGRKVALLSGIRVRRA